MRTRMRKTHVDWITAAVCIALIVLTLGAVGSSGRRRAKELVCQSNLRQWNTIFQNYLDTNDGRFFTGADHTPGYWWPQELDEDQKNWKRTKIWFCPEAVQPTYDEGGRMSLNHNVFNAWGIYTGTGLGPHGIAGSYGLNGYTITPEHASSYESGMPINMGWRVATVKGGASIPWFVDAVRFDLWPTQTDNPAESEFAAWSGGHGMTRCSINRHNGAVNCLFLDGSVRKVGLKELWALKWHKHYDTRGPYTTMGGVQTDDWPQWMRNFEEYYCDPAELWW